MKHTQASPSPRHRRFNPHPLSLLADAEAASESGNALFQRLGLPETGADQVAGIRQGFPVTLVEHLVAALQLPRHAVLRIAPATLARRRGPDARLSPEESDRLYRIAIVFGQAVALFEGDMDAAARWFSEPAKALGGTAPVEHLDTEAGAAQVHDLIGRLEHGIHT